MTASGTVGTYGPVDSSLEPIPLPETRRTRRVLQRRRRRRRRFRQGIGLVVVLAAVGLGAAAVLGGLGGSADAPARPVPWPRATPAAAPAPPVLVAHQGPGGRATWITVLAPAAKGGGGTVVLVPAGTMAEVVSLGLEPVSRSLELGGPSRLQATVENLLGVGLGGVAVVDDDGLASLLAPLGPLTVAVPERVEEVEPGGRVQVLYEPGPARVEPEGAARFLAARGRASDLARLARHQSFWEAWLAAVRQRPDAAPTQPEALARAFDALAAGDVGVRVVPVEAFGTGAGEGELYKVRADELARMVAGAFPAAAPAGSGARPRVQILNGTGAVGLADAVRARLGAGFDVRLTGNAARFDYERTEVVFYDRSEQALAQRVRQALGVGTLVLSRRPLDVVDVTVIVGKDFRTE